MNEITNKDFYDSISEHYDGMINIEASVEKRKIFFKDYIFNATKSVLDVGCGTGTDSLALASFGVKVTGMDPSSGMIEKAKLNAAKFELDINFEQMSIERLPAHMKNKYDLVVSTGNAIANVSVQYLENFIQNLSDAVAPQGLCIVHVLNYDLILKNKERIVNITEQSGKHFVRFYDFLNDKIIFNILSYSSSNKNEFKLISTPIYPHLHGLLFDKLLKYRLNVFKYYGGFDKSKFERSTSKDLVMIAQKSI
jgi:2-polyprenyl-3-methyl-5-hydroxy-6-metoxy-1,4-benzoquinol methylase